VLDFSQLTTPEERLDRIRGALTEADLPLGEMDHLLAALLDVPASLPPALSSNPQLQKQKTREMLIEWLRAAQREGPLLLIVEDVHWADPSTRELIAAACIALADTKLFIVLVHRQGHDTAWMDAHKPTDRPQSTDPARDPSRRRPCLEGLARRRRSSTGWSGRAAASAVRRELTRRGRDQRDTSRSRPGSGVGR
jgi:hypothetical protein